MPFIPGQKIMFETGPLLGEFATVKSVNGTAVIVTDAYGDDMETWEWRIALVPAE